MYKNAKEEESRQKREQEALVEHERMSKLFQESPAAFEMERRRQIVETIAKCNNLSIKNRLKESQKEFDRIMNGAGSDVNRFNMAEALLWHAVTNKFKPALQMFTQIKLIREDEQNKKDKIHLRLCKKNN